MLSFFKKNKSEKSQGRPEEEWPKFSFGPRGEDLHYQIPGKSIWISHTYGNGLRFYTDGFERWEHGGPITDDEKRKLFDDVTGFLSGGSQQTIVVINSDDPSSSLWNELCQKYASRISKVEFQTDEQLFENERTSHLECLKAGKALYINGHRVNGEDDLDRVMALFKKSRSSDAGIVSNLDSFLEELINIRSDLEKYSATDFEEEELDSIENFRIKSNLSNLLLRANGELESSDFSQIKSTSLNLFCEFTGCAEDEKLFLTLAKELLEQGVISQVEVDKVIKGCPTNRWK